MNPVRAMVVEDNPIARARLIALLAELDRFELFERVGGG